MKLFAGHLKIIYIILVFTLSTVSYSADFSGQVLVGYTGGPGFQVNLVTSNFARGFPLNLQFGVR